MRSGSEALAVLGGSPAFPDGLRFVHPKPPSLDRLADRLLPMLESGRLTNYGPYVQAFERAVAERLGVAHCVATANATLGLLLVPWVWQLGGEMIVPSFTFSATVHTLIWNRMTPVFVDIDPRTLTIAPDAVEAAISPRTQGIVAVCVFGTPPDLQALTEIARKHRLRLLCDTAQGFGSTYQQKPLGGFGDAEVLSFHAAKVLPTGEGGAVVTNDARLADGVRLACNFGNPGSGDCVVVGLNAKMMEWSAILGLAGLETFEQDLEYRRGLWNTYQQRLRTIPGLRLPDMPTPACMTNGQNCAIIVERDRFGLSRDDLERVLMAEGVECKRYFDPPVHLMRAYASVTARLTPLAETERIARAVLCLPLHAWMTKEDVVVVCDLIEAVHHQCTPIQRQLTKEFQRS